jgi:sugar-specific transcriptional regulator TrmB
MSKPLREDEVRNFLYDLELTKYETEVYLAILKYGPQNYKEIIKRSGVPYGKIYYTLTSLAKKGWIQSSNKRPRIFHVTDPEEVLQNHLARIQKQIHEVEELFRKVIPQLRAS